MYLLACKHLLESSFQDGWVDINKEASNATAPFFNLYSYLNDFSASFFKDFNLSVIKGEYVGESNFTTLLNDLESSFREFISNLPQEDNDEHNKFNDIMLNEFWSPISSAFSAYRKLYEIVNEKIKSPDKFLIEYIDKHILGNNTEHLDIYESVDFFINVNIELARYDHSLSINTEVFKELLFLLNGKILKDDFIGTDSAVKAILENKCNFLIKKIMARRKSDNGRYSFSTSTGFIDIDFTEGDCGPYNTFIKVMALHYFDDIEVPNSEPFKNKAVEALQKKEKGERLDYQDYHAIIKFYKDDKEDDVELTKLVKTFKEQQFNQQSLRTAFDLRSAQITMNYLENNLLSFYVDHFPDNIDELIKRVVLIEQLQSFTNVKSYFPYLKACVYIKNLLDKCFSESKVNIELVERAIEKLSEYDKKVVEYYEWCVEHAFIAFQAPYHECVNVGKVEGIEYHVFSYTSYVLPLNFEKDKKDIESTSLGILRYKTLAEMHRSISPEIKSIQDINEKVKAESKEVKRLVHQVENADRKNIEILSIFAAIVLFVASDIQMFPKVNSLFDALTFMIVFSYSLGLFAILIWLVTRDYSFDLYKIPRVHKWVMLIWVLSTIGAFGFIFKFQGGANLKSIPLSLLELRSKRDSLTKIIDSMTVAVQKGVQEMDSIPKAKVTNSKVPANPNL
jgi:hypothetical protein